mmetsp:Transcript_30383/g.44952  ORF Transcript_30383/g.44952 Transcript_30383/m.44952 type:complete len:216 (-) Transcript_30383:558-1205(-)
MFKAKASALTESGASPLLPINSELTMVAKAPTVAPTPTSKLALLLNDELATSATAPLSTATALHAAGMFWLLLTLILRSSNCVPFPSPTKAILMFGLLINEEAITSVNDPSLAKTQFNNEHSETVTLVISVKPLISEETMVPKSISVKVVSSTTTRPLTLETAAEPNPLLIVESRIVTLITGASSSLETLKTKRLVNAVQSQFVKIASNSRGPRA